MPLGSWKLLSKIFYLLLTLTRSKMVYIQFHKKDSSHNLISWLLKYTTCTPLRTISYVGIHNEKTTSWQKYCYSQSISYSIDSYCQDNKWYQLTNTSLRNWNSITQKNESKLWWNLIVIYIYIYIFWQVNMQILLNWKKTFSIKYYTKGCGLIMPNFLN